MREAAFMKLLFGYICEIVYPAIYNIVLFSRTIQLLLMQN